MTLTEIIEQLESCNYQCEAGSLSNNTAFIELKKLATQRYKLDSDDDGHYYIIPANKSEEFDAWVTATSNDTEFEGEDFNTYRIGGAPTLISFVDPQEDK